MFLHQNFCRLCLAGYSTPPFIACWGFSLGIPFVCYDVTPLPADAPPPLREPTNHGNSRQAVVLHMRYKCRPNTASFISPPAFEGETSTRYLAASY